MSQLTPGRRRNEQKHAKFNPDPKNVGTYSGKPMPTNVPRDANGMEDAAAFFDSSPVAPDTGKTGQTRRSTETPGTARKGRMSQLEDEASGDDTFGGGTSGADELLIDDDFPEDSNGAPLFRTNPNPSTSHQRTPSAGGNANPSPSSGSPRTYSRKQANNATGRKASTIGVGYRPSPIPASSIGVGAGGSPAPRSKGATSAASRAAEADNTGEQDMDLDLDDLEMDMDLDDDTGFADTTNGGAPQMEDEDEDHEDEVVKKGKSKAGKGKAKARVSGESNASGSGRRVRKDPDEEEGEEEQDDGFDGPEDLGEGGQAEDDDEEEAVQSRSELIQKGKLAQNGQRGKTAAVAPVEEDDEEEGGEGDEDQRMDDGGGQEGMDEEEDVGMEQDAVDAEEAGSGEEEQAPPLPRGKKAKAAALKAAQAKQRATAIPGTGGRNKRNANGQVVKKKSRISQIGAGESNGVEGDFTTRRSGRQHMKPLAAWRGEKVEYRKGKYGTEISSVVHIPVEPAEPLAARGKKRAGVRGRSQSVKPGGTGGGAGYEHPEAGWDDMTKSLGQVIDYETGIETERRVVFPARMLNPKVIEGEGFFRYQKVFGDDVYMASGLLELPANHGFKPEKSSKDNSYTFYVVQGAINMKIHRTSYILAPGGMTMVPRGNKYSIENISQTDAVLFFSQARKIRMREDEEAAHLESQGLSQSSQRATPKEGKRKRGSLKSVPEEEPEEEEGEGEEEEEEVVRAPLKGKKKGKAK